MCGSLLIAFGLAGLIKTTHHRSVVIGLCSGFLLMAMLFRHNGLFAVMPILAFLGVQLKPQLRWTGRVAIIVSAAALTLLAYVGVGAINRAAAQRYTNPWVASAVFDISGVIKRLDNPGGQQILFERLLTDIGSSGTLQPFLNAYNDQYWRGIYESVPPNVRLPDDAFGPVLHGFEHLSPSQLADLRALWRSAALDHPRLWLAHRWALSKFLLGLVPDTYWGSVMMAGDFPADLASAYAAQPMPTRLQAGLERVLLNHLDAWYFKVWIYGLATIGLAILGLSVRDPILLCICASALAYQAGLMLLAPSPDYRYSHYLIVCCVLAVLYSLSKQADFRLRMRR
jgi:hypothetical protein